MAEVGSVFVSVVPSMKGFSSRVGAEGSAAGSTFASNFSARASAGIGGLARVGGIVAAGIGAIGVAGIKAGLETASGMENAKIAFTTMLGSAQKASTFIKDLGAFAAKTPFEFPELQTAASSLISAGINASKVIPIMTTLGDVTSGMGTGSEGIKRATVALQQMNAAGRITGEDLNQLRDAGIPVYDLLASATGKSKAEVVKLAQAGKLGSTELGQMMKALETGKGLEKFSGLMAQQSKSLGGVWSTFKDNLNMSLAKALEPSLPAIKSGLTAVSNAIPPMIAGITSALSTLKPMFTWLAGNKPVLIGIAAAVGGLLVGAFAALAVSVIAATWPFLAIGAAIGLLVAGVVWAWTNFETFRTVATFVFNAVAAVVKTQIAVIVAIIKTGVKVAVAVFDFFKDIPGIVSGAWDAVKSATTTAWNATLSFIQGLPAKIIGFFKALPANLKQIGADIVNGFLGGIEGAWHFVTSKVEALIAKIPLAVRKMLGIASPSKVFAEIGWQMGMGLVTGMDRSGSLVEAATGRLVPSLAAGSVHSSVGATSTSPADRPILMPDGTLFGWIRQIATGEAELVLNNAVFGATMGARG